MPSHILIIIINCSCFHSAITLCHPKLSLFFLSLSLSLCGLHLGGVVVGGRGMAMVLD